MVFGAVASSWSLSTVDKIENNMATVLLRRDDVVEHLTV